MGMCTCACVQKICDYTCVMLCQCPHLGNCVTVLRVALRVSCLCAGAGEGNAYKVLPKEPGSSEGAWNQGLGVLRVPGTRVCLQGTARGQSGIL